MSNIYLKRSKLQLLYLLIHADSNGTRPPHIAKNCPPPPQRRTKAGKWVLSMIPPQDCYLWYSLIKECGEGLVWIYGELFNTLMGVGGGDRKYI